MGFALKRSWRDWFREAFIRQGLFSLRLLPENRAEAELKAEKSEAPGITRLELDDRSNK
jgi:hypothetical protein